MNPKDLLDWWPVVTSVVGYVVLSAVQWNKLTDKINGVGTRTNALEISVGSHETMLDSHDSQISTGMNEHKQLFEKIGEFKSLVEELRKASEARDGSVAKTLTDIQVELGKLGTKVDFLIEEKMK